MDPQTSNTVAGGILAIILALIGVPATRAGIKHSRNRRARDVDPEEREAVERYADDPGRFVRDILESNRQLLDEVKGLRKRVDELDKRDLEREATKTRFRNALARWMFDILEAWGKVPAMPYPRDGDEVILADVIPSALEATRPRRPKEQTP